MDTAPALASNTTASPTSTLAESNPIEPKDAAVTLPSSEESGARVAEERVQQGSLELKDGRPESGTMLWLSTSFLFAVLAVAALAGIVIYLFIRWRKTQQK